MRKGERLKNIILFLYHQQLFIFVTKCWEKKQKANSGVKKKLKKLNKKCKEIWCFNYFHEDDDDDDDDDVDDN